MLESIAENEHDFTAQKNVYFVLGEDYIIEQKMKTKEQYYQSIEQEYSQRFLQIHHLDPTPKNIKLVNQLFPLQKDDIIHKIVTKQNGKTIGVISIGSASQPSNQQLSIDPSHKLLLQNTTIPLENNNNPEKQKDEVIYSIDDLIENRQLFYSLLTNTNPLIVNRYVYYKSVPLLLPKLKQVEDSFTLTNWKFQTNKKPNSTLFLNIFPFYECLQRKMSVTQIHQLQQSTKHLIQTNESILFPILFDNFFTPNIYPTTTTTKVVATSSLSSLTCILFFVTHFQTLLLHVPYLHPYIQILFHQMELYLFQYFQVPFSVATLQHKPIFYLIQSKIKQELVKYCLCNSQFDFQTSQTMDSLLFTICN